MHGRSPQILPLENKNNAMKTTQENENNPVMVVDGKETLMEGEEHEDWDFDDDEDESTSTDVIKPPIRIPAWLDKLAEYWLLPWEVPLLGSRLLRSLKALEKERERQIQINKYLVHPMCRFRALWDTIMIIILVITLIILPVELAFYADDITQPAWAACNLLIDLLFLIDMCINFRTAYVIPETDEVILLNRPIIFKYLRSWFIIDFMSSFPLDYIIFLCVDGGSDGAVFARAVRVVRLTRLLSLLKVFRVARFMRYIQKIEARLQLEGRFINICNLVLLIMLFAHWNGCIQYFVPYLQHFPDDSWVKLDSMDGEDVSKWDIYTNALFRAFSHMLCIGYGRNIPQNNADIWVSVISMLTGASFYALFLANVSSLILSMNYSGRKFDERLAEVQEYLKFHKVPLALQQRIHDYYEHRYSRKLFDEGLLLNEENMSFPLKKEVLMHNCQRLVTRVPFLAKAPHPFLIEVITKLRMQVFFPGDIIVEAGTKGEEMYFIEHGMADVILPGGKIVRTLEDGTHFGEIALLYEEKRVASVIAKQVSDVYVLRKTDFNNVLKDYPSVKYNLMRMARKRLQSLSSQNSGYIPFSNQEKFEAVLKGEKIGNIDAIPDLSDFSFMPMTSSSNTEIEESYTSVDTQIAQHIHGSLAGLSKPSGSKTNVAASYIPNRPITPKSSKRSQKSIKSISLKSQRTSKRSQTSNKRSKQYEVGRDSSLEMQPVPDRDLPAEKVIGTTGSAELLPSYSGLGPGPSLPSATSQPLIWSDSFPEGAHVFAGSDIETNTSQHNAHASLNARKSHDSNFSDSVTSPTDDLPAIND